MSMENAILEHAAALKEVAAAVRALVDATMGSVIAGAVRTERSLSGRAVELISEEVNKMNAGRGDALKLPDPEIEQAVQKVEADAKKDAAAEPNPADSAAEKTNSQAAPSDDAPADLDYAKDVRPVLLAAIKKAGKDAVAAMLTTYGVDKADKLKAEQLPAVLAEAQKLAA